METTASWKGVKQTNDECGMLGVERVPSIPLPRVCGIYYPKNIRALFLLSLQAQCVLENTEWFHTVHLLLGMVVCV